MQAQPELDVEIMLHEYDTLREEVMRRYDAQFQVISIFAGISIGLVAAIAAGLNVYAAIALILVSAVTFTGLLVWIISDVASASSRLRELEAQINQLAQKTLLVWETNSKWSSLPFLRGWSRTDNQSAALIPKS